MAMILSRAYTVQNRRRLLCAASGSSPLSLSLRCRPRSMAVRMARPTMYQIPWLDADRRWYITRSVMASMLCSVPDSRAARMRCRAAM